MVERSKRLLSYPAFIVLFAYAARMAVFFYMSHVGPATPNPVRAFLPYGYELGLVARSIAAGQGFSSPLRFGETGPTAWFTPIYPYLTAGVFKIWGIFSDESRFILETLNCVFGALTVFPIYGIANRVFGKNVAAGAAWTWVFLPASFFFAISWIWDTALAALFLALIFWATLAMREAKSIGAWAGYGALWVTGVLINPSLLSLFPFLAGWALWPSRRDSSARVRFSAAMLLVFAIGLVPWTVRNYRVFGKFIPLRSNFGLELWLGNNPSVPDTWSPWLHPNDDPAEWAKYRRMGETAFMAAKEHDAFVFMRTHPVDTLNFMFRRFMETWLAVTESPVDIWGRSSLYPKAIFAMNVLLSLLAWLGAMFVNRNRHPEAAPFVMVLLIFPLVFYLTHSTLRYRFPMDPILVVLSVYAVAYLVSLARGRTTHAQESVTPAASLPTT